MKSQPLVSIIITCYNYADYIGEAIESAVAQTYKNTEIIVINDGSTDGSSRVIDAQRKKNQSLKVVERQNKGIIFTRNQGVSLAKGDYILQLDADDTLENTYVEECVGKALSDGLDIVYTQAKVFGRVEYTTKFIEHDLEKLKHDNYMHATSMVKRNILKENPYDDYLDKLGNEDWDLFLDLCMDGAKAGLVDKPLLQYRKHTDRMSRADSFEGSYREMLVRHHIWSKQNAKHPSEFWYFSTEIELLLGMIELHSEYTELHRKSEEMKKYIAALEKYHPVIMAKKLKKKLKTN